MIGLGVICFGGALLLGPAAATTIQVRGDSTCPTPEAVGAALHGMLPAATAGSAGPPDVVELAASGEIVALRLSTATGERIAEKRVPEGRSCSERARAAAVIVAAWEAHLHGSVAPRLPTARRGAPTVAAPAPAATFSTPSPPPAAIPATAPASVPATTLSAVAHQGETAPYRAPFFVEVGAAGIASAVDTGWALGVSTELQISRAASGFAVGLGALAVERHHTTVGAGQGSWRRIGGFVDLRSLNQWGPVGLEWRAGVVVTALAVNGDDYPVNMAATLLDAGGVMGFRSRLQLGRWAPWIDLAAMFWPANHTLYVVAETMTAANIPTSQLLLSAGLSWVAIP